MAKAAKKKPAATAPADTFELTVTTPPESAQIPALVKQARELVINSQETHERALELVKGWKGLKRVIVAHWAGVKRPVDQLKKNLLEQEKRDVDPIDLAIEVLSGKAIIYANDEKKRVEAAAEAERQRVEAEALAKRQRELQDAEDRAQKLEAESKSLSARELWFVTKYVERIEPAAAIGVAEKKMLAEVCKEAGFKDPAASVERLLKSEKIINAIAAQFQAIAIRQQAIAQQQAPLEVDEPLKEQPRTGYVAGVTTRTTIGVEVVDEAAIIKAMVERGELEGLEVKVPYLRERAKALPRGPFEQAYPGARWTSRQGLAG